jgi:hypothetical protein
VPCAVKQCEYIDVYHMTFCIVVIMDTICLWCYETSVIIYPLSAMW